MGGTLIRVQRTLESLRWSLTQCRRARSKRPLVEEILREHAAASSTVRTAFYQRCSTCRLPISSRATTAWRNASPFRQIVGQRTVYAAPGHSAVPFAGILHRCNAFVKQILFLRQDVVTILWLASDDVIGTTVN